MGKKVLISGYIGFSNFGDDVIFTILTRHLKAKGFDISALSSNPKKTAKQFKINAYKFSNPFEVLKAIASANYLISGGGSLMQNTTSNLSLLYYILVILFAKMMFKKVIIFAQGIGPVHGAFWQWLVKFTLSLCNVVTVRDKYSYKLLGKWKIKSRYVCDPGWDIPVLAPQNKGFVGIQLRSFQNLHPLFVKTLAKYIGIYFSDRKIVVFPFQNEQDAKICYQFEREYKAQWPQGILEVKTQPSIKKIIEDFSELEYLFAMRFHACLLGLKYGLKVMPLSYDIKVENLAKEFELPFIDTSAEPSGYNDLFSSFIQYKERKEITDKRKARFDWSAIDKYMLN